MRSSKPVELFGPHAVRLAREILYLNDLSPQSNGGKSTAAKKAGATKERDKNIRTEWHAMKAAGESRHGVGKKLSGKYKLSPYSINKILRAK